MSISLTVKAEVVDIIVDQPNSADSFLVDTNVWLWLVYPSISQDRPHYLDYQLKNYPSYIQKARSAKATLFNCGLSLAEMTHQVEQTERCIYKASVADVPTKDYRHNLPGERERVVGEIKRAWVQVKSFSKLLEISIDDFTTDAALESLTRSPLDGYDLFILEAMKKNGIRQIITDDGDFASVSDIQVFTANRNVIDTAREQGRLIKR